MTGHDHMGCNHTAWLSKIRPKRKESHKGCMCTSVGFYEESEHSIHASVQYDHDVSVHICGLSIRNLNTTIRCEGQIEDANIQARICSEEQETCYVQGGN